VLEDVADLEGITVSDEDVEARIRELVGDENVTEEFLRSRVGPEERESLRISIRRQKAREAVERHAVRIPAADYSQHMRRLRAGRNLVKRGGRKALLRRTRSSRARRTQSNG
jgi:FKBP-type peptidyl-prolyl cis-trans isomerase (trigger factor)